MLSIVCLLYLRRLARPCLPVCNIEQDFTGNGVVLRPIVLQRFPLVCLTTFFCVNLRFHQVLFVERVRGQSQDLVKVGNALACLPREEYPVARL